MKYTDFDQLPLLLTVKQLAAILGVSIHTAYDLVRSNHIESKRVGTQYRIPKESLKQYLDT